MEIAVVGSRLKHAWNTLLNKDPTTYYRDAGNGYSNRPDRPRLSRGNERSIVTSVYNRIAIDSASINIHHVRLDDDNRYLETIDSGLDNCLNLEANKDQTGRAFIHDAIISMLDEGCIVIMPIDTSTNPNITNSYDINSMRTGKVVAWYPEDVRISVYNDQTGLKEELLVPKRIVAIVENPLYAVINEPNSTMQRLIRKLNLLDAVDEQSSSGKLDLIIQLPYVVKTPAKEEQAEKRRNSIEKQLTGSKYGIAYTDGTEHITQLNRPVENNLMKQVEYLTSMLYSQLGITQSILDGTADEQTMINYYNRTIEPMVSALVDEMKRKFLTKTARSQKQSLMMFRDPFKLVTLTVLAEASDSLTRNEILSSNEIRQVIGRKPSSDPKADELINSNINQNKTTTNDAKDASMLEAQYTNNIRDLDDIDDELEQLETELGDDDLKHYASEHYDPQKAHEYYEKTKELKGRLSKKTLNDSGKEAASYVKDQLSTERKSKDSEEKENTQAQIDTHKNQMNAKIDTLRARLKGMSKDDKAANRESIQLEIDGLRADNKAVREKLRFEYKTKKANLKVEYESKYIQELDNIRSTKSFTKS